MKYLAIDWGKRKIGLAMGYSDSRVAVPFDILEYKKLEQVILEIKNIIKEDDVEGLIVGQPYERDGSVKQEKDFLKFLDELKKIELPVELLDERYTSKLANILTRDQSLKGKDDAVAAMLLLQSFFEMDT